MPISAQDLEEIKREVRAIAWDRPGDLYQLHRPPGDIKAEVAVLGAMCAKEWEGWAQVEPVFFLLPLHRWLARVMLLAHGAGVALTPGLLYARAKEEGVDPAAVVDACKWLTRQPWAGNYAEEAWQRVREMGRRRLLCDKLQRVVAALETDQRGTDAALDYVRGLEV